MNTNVRILISACAALMSFACGVTEEESSFVPKEGTEIIITAVKEGFGPDTRTIREPDGSVEWLPMEEISVFYNGGANGGCKFTSQNTEQEAIVEFKGEIDGVIAGGEAFTTGKYLYGVYPYSTNTSISDEGIATISLPSNQTAVEGTFANSLFPTIARSQNFNLAFYNICGGIKFTLSRNDITAIIFKGKNGERLAGTVKVRFDESGKPAVLDEEVGGEDEITVYAPAGGTFEVGKEYYIVAYPVKLNSGYTMTFITSDMKEGTYYDANSCEIYRSVFGSLAMADKTVTSWTDITSSGGGYNSGIYLGVMGFNQDLYSYPISELTDDNKVEMDSFIDDLTKKNGTLLYYSVEQAIKTMQSAKLPTDMSTAAIVTFTDGLDQGSVMKNPTYATNTQYLNAINNMIMQEKVAGRQSISAYSIGLRGQDVTDVTMFRNNLKKLASSDNNATEVTNMDDVNDRFKIIAEQLSKSNYIQTINLSIPGLSDQTLVRITFDDVSSPNNSSLYIEGTFNLKTRSLEKVEYKGLKSTSGKTIKGTVDGIFVEFTFEDVQTDDNTLIGSEYISQWTVSESNKWQINSEFDKTENSDIVTSRSSAVIMLVLDCSSSLSDDFVQVQSSAKDFINTLYGTISVGDN